MSFFSHRTLAAALLLIPSIAMSSPLPNYPETARGPVVDDYFGTRVADPYRWLEDVDAPATLAWVKAQQALANPLLAALPERAPLHQRLTALWNYERRSLPRFAGANRFFTKNDGLQNQPVLFVQGGKGRARVLLDPNPLSADGATALTMWEPSPDGRLVAYALAEAGSDWEVIRFREVASGKDLPDMLTRVKFSDLSWHAGGQVIAYSRYPEPMQGAQGTFEKLGGHSLYTHRLGTPQAEDVLVLKPEDASWFVGGEFTDDGRFLLTNVQRGTNDENRLGVRRMDARGTLVAEEKPLVIGEDFAAAFLPVGSVGNSLLLLTTDAAPRKRLIALDTSKPAREHWQELIPQTDDVLTDVIHAGGTLVAHSLHDVASRLTRHDMKGRKLSSVTLPGLGDASSVIGKPKQRAAYFAYHSFAAPGVIYRLDTRSGKVVKEWSPKLGFAPTDYVTEQVFYSSKDGTRVPMFISYKKGLKKDGSKPTLLYGYGGFNISLPPAFSVQNLVWMERGGIYAQANLRGGGEYGEAWHQAGTKAQKQNVFDDFIAAGEYLIAQKYTAAKHLGIYGRSNGGLLVGATINQRPELFAAAVPGVGVMDMLRFHQFTVGAAWRDDYGSSETAEGFGYLYPYSPLHNVKPGLAYPATLTITADHDDRVVPGHSFKYAAAMQAASTGNAKPQLIRIEERGGHGAGKPTAKKIDEVADVLAFLAHYTK